MANQTSPMTALSNDNDFTNAIMVSTDEKAVYFQPTPVLVDPVFGQMTVPGGISTTVATGSALLPAAATANARIIEVVFSGVNLAAADTVDLTVNNAFILDSSTTVGVSFYGATAGSALTINDVLVSEGQVSVTITNGTGATTSTQNITLVIQVFD